MMRGNLRKLNNTDINYQGDFLIPSRTLQLVFH